MALTTVARANATQEIVMVPTEASVSTENADLPSQATRLALVHSSAIAVQMLVIVEALQNIAVPAIATRGRVYKRLRIVPVNRIAFYEVCSHKWYVQVELFISHGARIRIVQGPEVLRGADPYYYLHKQSFAKQPQSGSIFIIFCHSMKNGYCLVTDRPIEPESVY